MEERDPNAVSVAQHLIQLFKGSFREMQFTVHPANLPSEAPGKSSNVSWAAKAIEHKYVNHQDWSSVLITVMDSKSFTSEVRRRRLTCNRRHPSSESVLRDRPRPPPPQAQRERLDRHDALHAADYL
jgi:hypothetical protein